MQTSYICPGYKLQMLLEADSKLPIFMREIFKNIHRTARAGHDIRKGIETLQRLSRQSVGLVANLLPCCLVIGSWQGLRKRVP